MKDKAFDCVEMKRQGQEAVRSATAGMTREQLLEYWKRKTTDLRRRQQESRASKPKSA